MSFSHAFVIALIFFLKKKNVFLKAHMALWEMKLEEFLPSSLQEIYIL